MSEVSVCSAANVVVMVRWSIHDVMLSMNKTTQAGDQTSAEMDACALECAKKGEPVALLTADGKVYRIGGALAADKNAKLVAHMNHTVEITGDVVEKDGKMVIAADTLKMSK